MKLDGLMRFIIMGIFQRITFSCSASKENLFVGYDHVENVIKPVNQEKNCLTFSAEIAKEISNKRGRLKLTFVFYSKLG